MLCSEIIAVCSQIHTKHNSVCADSGHSGRKGFNSSEFHPQLRTPPNYSLTEFPDSQL
jgi:hypothetical protein